MILYVATLLVKYFGLNLTTAKYYVKIALVIIGIIIALTLIFSIKSCLTPEPKIDQETIQKINSANEKERKAELEKTIKENSDVIKTVDDRNTISDLDVQERQKEIDKKVREAELKVQQSKNQGKDVTQEELKKILMSNE